MAAGMPSSLIEWDLLRSFLSLISTRSADLAAGELGISVATLKRRLARLEDIIGAKLYRGYEQNFALTNEGSDLASSLFAVDGVLGSIKPDLPNPPSKEKQTLNIWMMDVLFELFFVPVYERHVDLFRDYQVCVQSGDMPEITNRFQFDMTLAHYSSDSGTVKSIQVGVNQIGWGATRAYFETFGTPEINDLKNHNLVFVSDYRMIQPIWFGMEDVLLRVGSAVELDSTASCHALARRGLHFTLVTQWSSRGNYLTSPDLPTLELPIYLSFSEKYLQSTSGRQMIDVLLEECRDYFRREPDWPASGAAV